MTKHISMAEPVIKKEEIEAVTKVLESGHLASGDVVLDFENTFADMFGRNYGIATSSGTSALHTALLACGVKRKHEVIVPAFSFFSTASMVSAIGAFPMFVDVGIDGCISIEEVEDSITRATRAVIAVNLFGKLVPKMEELEQICRDYNVKLIVDSCQSPAKFGGIYGDVSCFSFYATKNITTGEGGMVVTSDDEIFVKSDQIINHGQDGKYNHVAIGYNYRMTDIAAALGLEQLKRIDAINARRREIAKMYNTALHGIVETPMFSDNHVFHQYVIEANGSRNDLQKYLYDEEIATAVHYPKPIPRQPVYMKTYMDEPYAVSDILCKSVLSLPCHPGLIDEDVTRVSDAVVKFYRGE